MATNRQRLLDAIKGDPELIARLLVLAEPENTAQILTSADAIAHFAPLLRGLAEERYAVLCLDRLHKVLSATVLTIGNDCACIVDARQTFRHALRTPRCTAIVMAHNHPAGDPTPSPQDLEVTRRMVRSGAIVGITVLDHIVIGSARDASLAELGHVQAQSRYSSLTS